MDIYIPKNSHYVLFIVLILSFIIYKVESNSQTRFKYSKFSDKNDHYKIKSKIGMIIIYFPSLLLFLSYILNSSIYFNSKVIIYYIFNIFHYLKRLIEVVFIHKYSSSIDIFTVISISFIYLSSSIVCSYYVNMVPFTYYNKKLIYIGIILFFIGEFINGYHHYLLSKLRKNNDIKYKIPKKALFKYIYCPHYLGEIISRLGCCIISHNILYIIFEVLTIVYLLTRANNTLNWYEDNFEKRKNMKRILPFLY